MPEISKLGNRCQGVFHARSGLQKCMRRESKDVSCMVQFSGFQAQGLLIEGWPPVGLKEQL